MSRNRDFLSRYPVIHCHSVGHSPAHGRDPTTANFSNPRLAITSTGLAPSLARIAKVVFPVRGFAAVSIPRRSAATTVYVLASSGAILRTFDVRFRIAVEEQQPGPARQYKINRGAESFRESDQNSASQVLILSRVQLRWE